MCDEVVPFVDARYPTLAAREHRGVSGKSSGGYGALVLSLLRPDLFGALASHAGRQDEFFLDLGALALSGELTRLGVDHSLELFDGNHDGVDRRMPAAIRELTRALQR